MGNLYRWCIAGLLAFVFVGSAFAGTYPATSGWTILNAQSFKGQTKAEACTAWATSLGRVGVDKDGYCAAYLGGGYTMDYYVSTTYCPNGGTLNGTICTKDCAAGEDLQANGTCLAACPLGEFRDPTQGNICVKDCTGKQGQAAPNGYYSTGTESWTGSVSGCQVRCSKLTALVISSSTAAIMQNCTYTGKAAQQSDPNLEAESPPNPNKPKSPKDCAGAGMGYILGSNGTATCVPASDAPEGNKPTVKTNTGKESGTDSNGDGKPDTNSPDYKKQETETTKTGDTVTSKTKETVNGVTDENGNVTCPAGFTKNADNTCSKMTATTQNASSFCQENPNSDQCKGAEKSTFGGGCDSGFTCSGDAATCASARAAHELKCSFQPDSTTGLHDAENPGGTVGQQGKAESALNSDGSKDFNIATEFSAKNQQWVNFSSGCPVGVQQFSILGKTLEIDASIVCDIGLFIRLMVHIVAYLGLARVFATKLV
jgi:hypothetical protein